MLSERQVFNVSNLVRRKGGEMMEDFNDMANTAEDYYQRQEEQRQSQRLLNEASWRAGYDVLTEGALGDYPEDCGW